MKTALKITSVSFRTNVQVEPYVHRHVEATAQVGPGQTAEQVLEALTRWVDDQLFEKETVKRPRR